MDWELFRGERWGLFPKLMRKLGFTSGYHSPALPKACKIGYLKSKEARGERNARNCLFSLLFFLFT